MLSLSDIHNSSFGSERREKIMILLRAGKRIPIGRSHTINLKYDTDLKKLLKKKKVKIISEYAGSYSHKYVRHSYIVINEV
jgi:hypothetical protein